MKIPAKIRILTFQEGERYELITEGTVDLSAPSPTIEYADGEAAFCIGVSKDSVTVTRLEKFSYSIVNVLGEKHQFIQDENLKLSVYTTKLKVKLLTDAISALVEYEISDNRFLKSKVKYMLKCTY